LKKILIIPVLFFILEACAQSDWKQSLRYDLHVKLNLHEKSLDAIMKLLYINHSPDTLHFIWFHVWPNAYRNDRTFYSEQLLENGDTRFYFSTKEQKGYLNRLDFRANGNMVKIEDHPEYIDVIKLLLPKPLLPGDSISISCSFHLQIPHNFNGNGYSTHHFELKNWYPEPAVYDKKGWHAIPFLLQGGAYHEAADYTVLIEAPISYRIATGAVADTISQSAATNLYRFTLNNANGFAWVADSHFQLKTEDVQGDSGRQIHLQYFYESPEFINSDSLFAAAKREIRQLSLWLIPYPHPTITIVHASNLNDQDFSGLACLGGNIDNHNWQLPLCTVLTRQWFQTILMTDQRQQAGFSRGFADFYEQRLLKQFPQKRVGNKGHGRIFAGMYPVAPDRSLMIRLAERERSIQPVLTPTPDFSSLNDTVVAEYKAGLWLKLLYDSTGHVRFDENMKEYFSLWRFGHPYPDDFKKAMDRGAPQDFQPLFEKLNGNESLFKSSTNRIWKPAFIFSSQNTERNNYIGLSPLVAFNHYDGFMLGALIHNINLPENKFEFFFIPMYGLGSKRPEGLGRLSYSWHPDQHVGRISIGLNADHFASNKGTDSTGSFLFEDFLKLVPYVRVDFRKTNPRSSISKWIDFKTYLITETNFGHFAVSSKDSLIHPNSANHNFRYLNQLSFNLEDARTLYPYDLRVEFQQSALFYRINLQANYFLNYPDGGGMRVRFFAAKFGVWNENNNTLVSRYEPKLLGVNGDEDYLYENYFAGRSASYAIENASVSNGGLYAQQIMNRDGGLKLRIDDYPYLEGKSADWITALNFNTTLPAKLFPFSLPVRVFFDFGTYAEAWENNPPTSRFLYAGGIQISLFRNLLNIYAPLFYSSDFKTALGSTGFGRKITFSIDIQHINAKKFIQKAARS
jgi:hypothetical protein